MQIAGHSGDAKTLEKDWIQGSGANLPFEFGTRECRNGR